MLKEFQVEKQKTSRVEAMLRDQCAVLEKELGNMQAKAQGSYQEHQTMQIKVRAFNFLLKCGDLLCVMNCYETQTFDIFIETILLCVV